MCDPALCPNTLGQGRFAVDRAQRIIADSGRAELDIDHVPLAKATGRVLAQSVGTPLGAGLQGSADVLVSGTLLSANHVPLLASLGGPTLSVFRRLRVGILTTGVHRTSAGRPPASGQSYNLAAPVLASMLDGLGAQPFAAAHPGSGEHALGSRLDMLLAECNIVLVAGCKDDAQYEAIERALASRGAALSLCRVRMRPRVTVGLARLGRKLVVFMPAEPAAVFMAFVLFISPLIRRLQGRHDVFPGAFTVGSTGGSALPPNRDRFMWAREVVGEGGRTHLLISTRQPDGLNAIGRATGIARQAQGEALLPETRLRYYAFARWLR